MKIIPNEIFFSQVESQLQQGNSVRFRVKGHSMFPLLRNDKDEVLLSALPVSSVPQLHDIVLFRFKGKHILHRIISIQGDKYIIQGDGVYLSSEYCGLNDIVGVVTHICRPSGKVIPVGSIWLKNWFRIWFLFRFARRYLLAILRRVYK